MRFILTACSVLFALVAVAQVDTRDGTAITSSTTLDGETGIDTADGQAITSGGTTEANWGNDAEFSATTPATMSQQRFIGGTSPATAGMTLQQVCIFANNGSGNLRLAVYQGGVSDENNTGADLVEDLGTIAAGGTTWTCLASSTNPALAASTLTFIHWKADDNTWGYQLDTNVAHNGDFTGDKKACVECSNSEAVAYPNPNGEYTISDIGTAVPGLYLTYAY